MLELIISFVGEPTVEALRIIVGLLLALGMTAMLITQRGKKQGWFDAEQAGVWSARISGILGLLTTVLVFLSGGNEEGVEAITLLVDGFVNVMFSGGSIAFVSWVIYQVGKLINAVQTAAELQGLKGDGPPDGGSNVRAFAPAKG